MGNILAPFKKFLSNKNTITILGVLLGVVVLFLGYRWRVNEAINPQTILYAKRTLSPEDPITAEDIGTTTISNSTLKNMTNVINTEGDLIGKIVAFDSHDNLLKNCQVYIDIYNSQLKREGVFDE